MAMMREVLKSCLLGHQHALKFAWLPCRLPTLMYVTSEASCCRVGWSSARAQGAQQATPPCLISLRGFSRCRWGADSLQMQQNPGCLQQITVQVLNANRILPSLLGTTKGVVHITLLLLYWCLTLHRRRT
jgi:hypothetical protein